MTPHRDRQIINKIISEISVLSTMTKNIDWR